MPWDDSCSNVMTYNLPSKTGVVLLVKLMGVSARKLESIVTVR